MKTLFFIIYLSAFMAFAQNQFEMKGNKIYFLNENFGAVIKENGAVAITKDGAKNWDHITIDTNLQFRQVLFTSENNGWIVSSDYIFKTTDGGDTWSKNATFLNEYLWSLYFLNDSLGFISGSTIYKTENCGKTWKPTIIDTTLLMNVTDFSFMNDSVGIAVGTYTVHKTINGGNNWYKLPVNFYIGGLNPNSGKMIDENKIILTASEPVVVAEGLLYSTNDEGKNWSNYGNGQYFTWGISDQFFLNKDTIWLSTRSKIYRTFNAAKTWDTLDIEVDRFGFANNKIAYGLKGSNLIYTSDGWETYTIIDTNITSISEDDYLPNKYILSQNYPNPFNPSTTIDFYLPKTANAKLSIYNSLGERVKILPNKHYSAGKHQISFTAQNLPSGVYFYSIETEEYFECKKMCLIK